MNEKLCIFCEHFHWSKEEMWGMGSTMTGPMFEGGDATCDKGHMKDTPTPYDEAEYRAIILRGAKRPDYKQVV